MINPMIVEGQIAGGVIQGIGGVLYEHCVYDDDGNPLDDHVHGLPAADRDRGARPSSTATSRRRRRRPGGHKGMGEGGAIGSAPAIFNAVADALAPLGVTVTSQPLGPNDIFELIHAND